ncbi:MAG: bifunctional oligoribonuclease/PAP phosphatase NrnA [Phycisphaerales bacterium]|nr:bifunctional oligoribonuclease/PAP phosphatase NrnA [Phycisphaerales bacterium]
MTHHTASHATCAGAGIPCGLVDRVASMRQPLVIAHVVPDTDALGSMFGFALAYAGNCCRPKVALPKGSLSQKNAFMHDWAKVEIATPEDYKTADGFVVLDTAKKPRCNVDACFKDVDWSAGRPVVNIDHHDTNTQFGDVNWVIPDATSCAEIVYKLLVAAGKPISPMAATMLYGGIHGDTLGFSLPSTSAESLRIAAELVALGANVSELCENLCRSQTRSEFDLLRHVYANTKVVADGRVAYSTLSHAEITGAGCTAQDIDDQVSIPRSLRGVKLSFLLSEGNKGKTRINFRGEGNVDVLELAKKFNGGGHTQAAGAVIDGTIPQVESQVAAAAVEHIGKY